MREGSVLAGDPVVVAIETRAVAGLAAVERCGAARLRIGTARVVHAGRGRGLVLRLFLGLRRLRSDGDLRLRSGFVLDGIGDRRGDGGLGRGRRRLDGGRRGGELLGDLADGGDWRRDRRGGRVVGAIATPAIRTARLAPPIASDAIPVRPSRRRSPPRPAASARTAPIRKRTTNVPIAPRKSRRPKRVAEIEPPTRASRRTTAAHPRTTNRGVRERTVGATGAGERAKSSPAKPSIEPFGTDHGASIRCDASADIDAAVNSGGRPNCGRTRSGTARPSGCPATVVGRSGSTGNRSGSSRRRRVAWGSSGAGHDGRPCAVAQRHGVRRPSTR